MELGGSVSYLVLARKWRPTTFDEVIGQAHVTQTLKNAIELNRVAHALLFTGSRGIGKTTCARILSKALNCENGPTTTPCGVCPSCLEITGGTSVDVFEIDGASNNSVEQIREIRESVKFMPAKGRRKVYIIDEVHMLSTSAFNALLKTLEEPPEHVLFVFATTEPHKIPDTIHSRCQRYDFKRIPERTIVDALKGIANAEGLTIEETALFHVAREAQGGMRDSLSLLDQVIAYCGLNITETQTREVLGIADRAAFGDLVTAIMERDGQSALRLVEIQFRRGLDLQKFAAEFVRHVRDLVVVKVCPDAPDLVDVPPDELNLMASQVAEIPPPQLHRILNTMLKGAEEVSRSPFPKLVLEMTLLRLCTQGTTLALAEVLDGISRLESHLQGQGHSAGSIDALVSPTGVIGPKEEESMRAAPLPGPALTDAAPPSPPVRPAEEAPAPIAAPVDRPPTIVAEDSETGDESSQVSEVSPPDQPNAETSVPEAPPRVRAQDVRTPEPAEASGFKRRPTGDEVEYDDLSAPPVQPRPIESLRALKVKKRASSALPDAEVQPFIVEGPPPIIMVEVTEPEPETPSVAETARQPVSPVDESESPPSSEDAHVEPPSEDDGLRPPWESTAEEAVLSKYPDESDDLENSDKISVNDGRETIEHFADLLNLVRREDSFLASELEQSLHLVSFTGGVIVMVSSIEQYAQLGENSFDILGRVARQSLNPAHEIVIEQCAAGDDRLGIETLFERKNRLEQEVRKARRVAATNAPGVANASELLNAEIIDVQLVPKET